jgi:hypothetical protein
MFSLRNAGDEADIKHEAKEIEEGHQFFPAIQKPTYISLGSANFWPAGGLRKADAKYLWELANRRSTSIPKAEQTVRKAQDAAQACAELSRRAEILPRSVPRVQVGLSPVRADARGTRAQSNCR